MPYLLLQTIVIPLAAAVIILLPRLHKGIVFCGIAIGSLVYTSVILGIVGWRIHTLGPQIEIYNLGPEVTLNLLADGLSIPIALIINLICIALACYSFHYVEHRIDHIYSDENKHSKSTYFRRFFFLYLFFPAGFMGVAFSTNLISIYLFLELLTIVPLYFIMAQFGYSDYISRYNVALMCLFWGVAGATFFLIGIILGYTQIGSFEIADLSQLAGRPQAFWVALLVLIGLGTKLAIIPLHVWMPWVHAEHPTCIAGLLAIYANIAVYVVVRVLILPLINDMQIFSTPLMIMAMITMAYGGFLTLAQSDIKRFCACSTISQISYSVFGIAALNQIGVQGGIFYFISHIIGKAILFSTGGILVYTLATRDMRQMGGVWQKMPLTTILWFSAALILSALPITSGFVGKWLLFAGTFQKVLFDPVGVGIVVMAILSTLITLIYTFTAGIRIFFGPQKTIIDGIPAKDPPLSMSIPLLVLAVVAFTLGIFPAPILSLLSRALTSLPI